MKCSKCHEEADFCGVVDAWDDYLVEEWFCPRCDRLYEVVFKDEKIVKVVEV